jgi:hypothetical protein
MYKSNHKNKFYSLQRGTKESNLHITYLSKQFSDCTVVCTKHLQEYITK